MEYTTNYHLPQWVETDRIMMGDFNQMCSDIDEGIAEAKEAADAAQQEAEEKGFVIGSYTGNAPSSGTDPGQLITLGFLPSFLLITRGWASNISSSSFLVIGKARVKAQDSVFEWKDNGFVVKDTNTSGPLQLNTAGMVYDYIAFR